METSLNFVPFFAVSILQWGHGAEAVETTPVAAAVLPTNTLQWGHGAEAVETW